jgi:hypothetical protein
MLLSWSSPTFLLGLTIEVFATAGAALSLGDENKITVFFGCFMAFVVAYYMLN